MTNETALAEVVRAWAAGMLPGEPDAADSAAEMAREAFRHGATVTEACQLARSFLESWSNHPAHLESDRGLRLVS